MSKFLHEYLNFPRISKKQPKINEYDIEEKIVKLNPEWKVFNQDNTNKISKQQLYELASSLNYLGPLQIIFISSINKQDCSIILRAYIMKNAVPVSIRSTAVKLQVIKHLNRLNSNMKNSYVYVESNGAICFKSMSFLINHVFGEFINNLKNQVEKEKQQLLNLIKQHLPTLLQLINHEDAQILSMMDGSDSVQKRRKQMHQHTQLLSRMINHSSYKQQFMYDKALKLKPTASSSQKDTRDKQEMKQKNQRLSRSYESFKSIQYFNQHQSRRELQRKVKPIFELTDEPLNFTVFHNIHQMQKVFSEEQNQCFHNNLIIPHLKSSDQKQRLQILNPITLTNGGNWRTFSLGGTSKISFAKVEMVYQKTLGLNEKPKYTLVRNLVKKQPLNKSFQVNISHEYYILRQIRNYTFPYVAKFYYVQKQPYILYLDFCACGSLDGLTKANSAHFSLFNKLHILTQTTTALRFLQYNQISHNDMKPGNILISRNMIVKVSDFGQANHPNVTYMQPGFTLPYIDPQLQKWSFKKHQLIKKNNNKIQREKYNLIQNKPMSQEDYQKLLQQRLQFDQNKLKYGPGLDTYSVGIILHQLLYNCHPFTLRQSSVDFLRKNINDNYVLQRILIAPQKLRWHGPPTFMQLIHRVILKCLQQNLHNRPRMDWLNLIIHQLHIAMNHIYS